MKNFLKSRSAYFNLPNSVSFMRVALIPVVVILMAFQEPPTSSYFHIWLGYLVAFFFVVTGISDLVDGYYARKMGLSTVFGKFIDPLADKLIHMAVMVMLIPLGEIPAWLVVLFLFREFTITALRSVAAAEGVVMAADVWGKKKTALLNVALTCFLLPPSFLGLNSRSVGWVVLMMALFVSLFSGINYCRKFFKR